MSIFENLPADWLEMLSSELEKPYIQKLDTKVQEARKTSTIYPSEEDTFAAFHACPFASCRLLLLGQDPYHGPGQAHGLSFSVPEGIKIPPSLRNMYKERLSDIKLPIPKSGNLSKWAKQGVLLLNACLTVEEGKAGSHATWGWMEFTDAVIRTLSQREPPMVFLLWGDFAKKKIPLIDDSKHKIIYSAHPSPLSANTGFFGSKPYSKVNEALVSLGQEAIDWSL